MAEHRCLPPFLDIACTFPCHSEHRRGIHSIEFQYDGLGCEEQFLPELSIAVIFRRVLYGFGAVDQISSRSLQMVSSNAFACLERLPKPLAMMEKYSSLPLRLFKYPDSETTPVIEPVFARMLCASG
jgi:hypothetical protein